ncbi:uncharacterized protein LOC144421957 [Styela clava]
MQKCYVPNCDAKIRLTSEAEGYVQIKDDSNSFQPKWRYICQDFISDDTVAETVCNQLGYGFSYESQPNEVVGNYLTFLSLWNCPANDRYLMQCVHSWEENRSCSKRLMIKCSAISEVACENTALNIECASGKVIQIVDAMFGRIDNNICSSAGSENSCMATGALQKVRNTCEGYAQCSLTASSQIFGDPCPGVNKYLKVDFMCILSEISWSSWSTWTLCSTNEKQERRRYRHNKGKIVSNSDVLETRICQALHTGIVESGWFDGSNGFQYTILKDAFDSIHSAKIACYNLNSNVISQGLFPIDKARELSQLVTMYYKENNEIMTIWTGITRHESNGSQIWYSSEKEPEPDELLLYFNNFNFTFNCIRAKIDDFVLLSTPCEYHYQSLVVCEKPIDILHIGITESSKLTAFDERTFSVKQLTSSVWTKPNGDVICHQFSKKSIANYEMFWNGKMYIPLTRVLQYANDFKLSALARCVAVGGTTQDWTKNDIFTGDLPTSTHNATLKEMLRLNFNDCVNNAHNAVCSYLHSDITLSICETTETCSYGLGMENGIIKSSNIFVSSAYDSKNRGDMARLHWSGFEYYNNLESLSKCTGWKPKTDDKQPWIIIKLNDLHNITSIGVAKSSANNLENINLFIWYSLDGNIWYGPGYKNQPGTIFMSSSHRIGNIRFTDKNTQVVLPFPASYIKIQSQKPVMDSYVL